VAAKADFVEIEVETLDELREALDAGARMVLLDNMSLPTLHEAVRINAERGEPHSGNLGRRHAGRLRALAETGVDRISIGTLTKDVKATDYSMRFRGPGMPDP
jgi:nicotinate-nucleotide pyrophosphorylase (carboxylating)